MDIEPSGKLGFFLNEEGHISSFRNTNYSFLVKLKQAGLYLITFAMPSSGIIGYKDKPVKYDESDPNIMGTFSGEAKSLYTVLVDQK